MCYIQQASAQCRSVTVNLHSFLQVVANKKTGVDVDKWDYILRDGQSLGIKVCICTPYTL